MQIHRLTEIVFALLRNERITAKELSERFDVSTRTIYRDIDILSASGVPVYTDKGNGGGISIAENYRLDKAILSDVDKENIIAMMTAYNAAINTDSTANLLNKLAAVFGTSNNFIEVDLSDWHNNDNVQRSFDTLKCCIIDKRVAIIEYCNAAGEDNMREIEPLKLIFKHRNWYLYAYCRLREENRLFKLARIHGIDRSDENFTRICDESDIAKKLEWNGDVLDITLKINASMKNRIYDDYVSDSVTVSEDGKYIVRQRIPLDDWAIGYILSYGDCVEVMEPLWLKDKIRDIHKSAAEIQKYS